MHNIDHLYHVPWNWISTTFETNEHSGPHKWSHTLKQWYFLMLFESTFWAHSWRIACNLETFLVDIFNRDISFVIVSQELWLYSVVEEPKLAGAYLRPSPIRPSPGFLYSTVLFWVILFLFFPCPRHQVYAYCINFHFFAWLLHLLRAIQVQTGLSCRVLSTSNACRIFSSPFKVCGSCSFSALLGRSSYSGLALRQWMFQLMWKLPYNV